ncbi:MAG: protein kinase [Pyrinomonadaceae bacterium]
MADEFTGKVIADKYRVDSLIRKGDLGDMYRGWHLFMDKPVTLKILPSSLAADESIRKQFSAEARNAVLISHPNILAVSDFAANADGSVYIVFEGFEGETLTEFISTDGQFAPERAVDIAAQTASALASASAKDVIHGKLNPDKILVANSAEGSVRVKVFDFSSTENYVQRAASDKNIAYTAPEQFSGLKKPDARTDVYSLGVILYQMLAGATPFNGETPTDIMLKHTEEEPPPISPFHKDMPPAVEPVVFKALAKDPDLRYQSAQEFSAELDQLAYGLANPAVPSGNNIWKTAFIVLAGISVLAVALIYGTSVKQTNPITQLQPDVNGQPVQPINPATGLEEQNLALMPSIMTGAMSNTNMMEQPPGTLPGGDNYNPWGNGGMPPPGAPLPGYVPPGGQVYMIDTNTGSPFMPPDGVVLVPVPVNTNTGVKPTPTPKTPAANANVSTVQPPTNTTVKQPAVKATPTPVKVSPSANKP